MKNKQIVLAAIAAISATSPVQAGNVTINMTGSSAFRASTVNAILNLMKPANGGSLTGYAWGGATSFTSSNYHVFVGTISGITGTVTVKTQWSGSVAGIQNVAQGNAIGFLGTGTIPVGGTSGLVTTGLTTSVPDIAMADNFQSSTIYKTPALTSQVKVGIIPFAWVAGKDSSSNLKNITAQQAKSLLTAGVLPTSAFTGNAADTQLVFLGGRDNLSGTRVVTLGEIAYKLNDPVVQFTPSPAAVSNVVSSIDITSGGGNGGESSGGNLVNYTRYTTTAVTDNSGFSTLSGGPMSFLAYMGEADSYAAVYAVGGGSTAANAGNAKYLTYNGVKAFDGVAKAPASINTTSGNPTITGLTDTTGVIAGQVVAGDGIAGGSTVVSTTATTVTLDKNAIATISGVTNCRIGALIPSVIRNGAYPFWNYEFLSYKAFTGTAQEVIDKTTFATKLSNRIINNDYGYSGLANDAAMLVERGDDGAIITLK